MTPDKSKTMDAAEKLMLDLMEKHPGASKSSLLALFQNVARERPEVLRAIVGNFMKHSSISMQPTKYVGRAIAPCGRAPCDGDGSAGEHPASRGPSGPFADATYLTAIFAGSAIAWLGRGGLLDRSWSRCSSAPESRPPRSEIFILLAYTWAGLEPDVSLADIFYYAGYLGLGAAMLVIVLQNRQDVRRAHR